MSFFYIMQKLHRLWKLRTYAFPSINFKQICFTLYILGYVAHNSSNTWHPRGIFKKLRIQNAFAYAIEPLLIKACSTIWTRPGSCFDLLVALVKSDISSIFNTVPEEVGRKGKYFQVNIFQVKICNQTYNHFL